MRHLTAAVVVVLHARRIRLCRLEALVEALLDQVPVGGALDGDEGLVFSW